VTTSRFFSYDKKEFQKRIWIRSGVVFLSFLFYAIWNARSLAASERNEFFVFFLPLVLILLFFLYLLNKKQMDLLSQGLLEWTGDEIRQWDKDKVCVTISVSEIQAITTDRFRGYERIIFETEEKLYPFVNLEKQIELQALVEEKTGVKAELDSFKESSFLDIRTWVILSPGLLVAVVPIFLPELFTSVPKNLTSLVLSGNFVILFLYWREKPNPSMPGFSMKRRLLFISLMVFCFVVYEEWKSKGLLNF